jgi:hypothetical protein
VTHPPCPPRLRRLALLGGGLCLSALAVAALLFVERELARAELALLPDFAHEAVRAPPPLPALAASTEEAPAPATEPGRAEPAQAAPLLVPDFTGKRLSVARREARALGLKLVARDAYGERISADVAAYYRVRKQLTAAGTPLSPGDVVQVRVRDAAVAMGY